MNAGPPHAAPEPPDPLEETWRSVGQVFSAPPPPTPPAVTVPEPPPPPPYAPGALALPGRAPGTTVTEATPLPPPPPDGTAPHIPVLGVPRHSGPKPPLYPAEPRHIPAVRRDPTAALIPDIVVDGAAYGSLTVRAASVRGDSHRYQSEPRQDSLALTRIGEPGRDELLLLTVADGVGSAARSHVGSQEACRLAALLLDDASADLTGALRAGDQERFASLVETAVQRAGTLLTHHAHERGDDPAAYATTLRGLLVPLDPEIRTRGFLAVGDGGTALLRDTAWHLTLTDPEHGDDGMIDTRTAALPHDHGVHARLLGPALPGDVLVLCTDGLSAPLSGDGGMRDFLRAAWGSGTVPAPADFLWQLQYRVKSYDDDRTAAVLWEGTP